MDVAVLADVVEAGLFGWRRAERRQSTSDGRERPDAQCFAHIGRLKLDRLPEEDARPCTGVDAARIRALRDEAFRQTAWAISRR